MQKKQMIILIVLIIVSILLLIVIAYGMFYQSNVVLKETENTQSTSEGVESMDNQSEIKINLIVNNKTFSGTLNNNQTTQELIQHFPMILDMSDLNLNEKYNYLDYKLTTNSSRPSKINVGDIKLYGDNCLVIFYESFFNSYSYTDLGRVDDVDDFISELGKDTVTIKFELAI